jgi:hypothetical protein
MIANVISQVNARLRAGGAIGYTRLSRLERPVFILASQNYGAFEGVQRQSNVRKSGMPGGGPESEKSPD